MTDSVSVGNLLTIAVLIASSAFQIAAMRGQIETMRTQISSLRESMEARVDTLEKRLEERISLQERAQQNLSSSFSMITGIVDRHDVYVGLIVKRCLGSPASVQETCPHDSGKIELPIWKESNIKDA